jgi:hypothetical protein
MLHISYKTDVSFKDIIKNINVKSKQVEAEVMKLGIETKEKMHSIIKANKKRPQAGEPTKLENAIDVERIQEGINIIGWGVGNISRLEKEAPGYLAVNFGSSHMVGKHLPVGGFAPGEAEPNEANFREGRWKKGGGNYSPIVTKPIPPMNFISKTVFWLSGALDKISRVLQR